MKPLKWNKNRDQFTLSKARRKTKIVASRTDALNVRSIRKNFEPLAGHNAPQ
jgi:hypothetical protein